MDTLDRALAIVNAIALAAQPRGFTVKDDQEIGRLVLVGHGAEVPFRIAEQLETIPWRGVSSFGFGNHKEPTGRLRLTIGTTYALDGPNIEDQPQVPLESELNGFYSMIYRQTLKQRQSTRAAEAKRLREEAKARDEEVRRIERARIWEEEARIQAEAERLVAEEREKRQQLISQSAQWVQARQIREYVSHAQQRFSNRPEMNDWCIWALSVADEIALISVLPEKFGMPSKR